MNRLSRRTFIAGTLTLTILVGASLACNRGNRQNNTAPTTNPPAVQAPATQPPQATAAPTDQPTSVPATQAQPAATAQPTDAPTLVPPTATEGTSEADALGAQVDDLLNQLDAANKSTDDLSDANP